MSKIIQLSILSIGILLGLSSCIKDKNPGIPAYIHVPHVQFTQGDPLFEGSASHNFVDAWISVDRQLIGVNNLPTTLPAILNDSPVHKVSIRPGIIKNGISSSRAFYPFFAAYELDLALMPAKIDTIYPVFSYLPTAKIIIIDDFEGPGVVFGEEYDDFPDSRLIKSSEDVFEGSYSGKLYVDSLNIECYVATSFNYQNLQQVGTASAVYLEMNYKTNNIMYVGLIAHLPSGTDEVYVKGGVNPIDGWNKIYFDLTEDLYRLNATSYSVFLRVIKNVNNKDPKIYIDNIKLVHF